MGSASARVSSDDGTIFFNCLRIGAQAFGPSSTLVSVYSTCLVLFFNSDLSLVEAARNFKPLTPSCGAPSSMPFHPLRPGQWEEQQPSYDAFVKLSAAAGAPVRPDHPEDDTESSPALSIDDILVDFPEDYVSLNYTGSPASHDDRQLSPDYPAGPSNIGVRSARGYRESTAAERYAVHRVDDTIYDGQYIAVREPGPCQRPPPYTAPHIDRPDADLRSSVCLVN